MITVAMWMMPASIKPPATKSSVRLIGSPRG